MEELTILAACATASALVLLVADLFGLMLGFGWGHYSKKLQAKRRLREASHD